MRPRLYMLSIMALIYSCNSGNNESGNHNQSNLSSGSTDELSSKVLSAALSVSVIQSKPKEIDGCACYFSFDSLDYLANKFVFMSNMDSLAFISVNDSITKLQLVKSGRDPDTFGSHDYTDIYESQHFKVTANIKFKQANGGETWWNEGLLTIENKSGQKTIQKIIGECGC